MRRILAALLLTSALVSPAFAQTNGATGIPTPPVPPTESGENSTDNRSIISVARLKLGYCTATTAGSEAAQTATCNGAMGELTGGFSTTVTSGAKDLVTVTNNKVLATDSCQVTVDDTGAAANSTPVATSCRVSAGQIIIVISNITSTSPAAALKYYFTIITGGNPR